MPILKSLPEPMAFDYNDPYDAAENADFEREVREANRPLEQFRRDRESASETTTPRPLPGGSRSESRLLRFLLDGALLTNGASVALEFGLNQIAARAGGGGASLKCSPQDFVGANGPQGLRRCHNLPPLNPRTTPPSSSTTPFEARHWGDFIKDVIQRIG